jgi:Transposase IS66 family
MADAANQWEGMMRYLEAPEAELDNNLIEHALRSVVLGRRNGLHVGQEVGGRRAVNLFILTGSCRRLGMEPYAYLCDISLVWGVTPRRTSGR